MTKYTINDYLAQVKALRELGQLLVEEQYNECDEPAFWVQELECMDMHLDCCIDELKACGVRG